MQSKIEHFLQNRKEYDFQFELVMKEQESRQLFRDYLEQVERNHESILLLDAISHFHSKINTVHSGHTSVDTICNEFERLVREMMQEYFDECSIKQVNIGYDVLKTLQDKIARILKYSRKCSTKTLSMQQKQYHVFSDIEVMMNCMLKMDPFPRFMRSKQWNQFLNQCCSRTGGGGIGGGDYTGRFRIIERISVHHDQRFASYTLDDIKRPTVCDEDFHFVKLVSSDQSHWIQIPNPYNKKLEHPNQRIEVYQSQKQFIFANEEKSSSSSSSHSNGNSGNSSSRSLHQQQQQQQASLSSGNSSAPMTSNEKYQAKLTKSLMRLKTPMKFTFYLPFHYEHAVAALQSEELRENNKDFAYHVIDHSHVDPDSGNRYAFCTVLLEMSMPGFFSRREACYVVSCRRDRIDGKEACLLIVRPFNDFEVGKARESNQRCRLMQCWTFVKIHERLTRVTMVLFMEFGGALAPFSKQLYGQQIRLTKKYRDDIERALEKMEKESFLRPKNTLNLLEMYEENNLSKKENASIYCPVTVVSEPSLTHTEDTDTSTETSQIAV